MALLGSLVALVLVIACANVATLMANRARTRARELAVRQAIGANRGRVVRQLLVESLLIAGGGGAIGLAIATVAVRLFPLIDVAGDIPIAPVFQIDYRVLWLTMLASAVGAILCGLLPALYAVRADLVSVLKVGPAGGRRERLAGRSALVTLQVAGALVLIAAALQLWGGMAAALRADLGYRVDRRLTMRLDPGLASYDQSRSDQFYRTLRDRVAEVPGVKAVALSSWIPMADGWGSLPVVPEAFQFRPGQESARVLVNIVDDQFLRTLSVPIVAGRGIEHTDRVDTPLVVVVNEVFAQKYLGGQPLGKRLRLPTLGDRTAEVVGVSATGKNISAFEPPTDFLYLPFAQHPQTRMTVTVETEGDAAALAAPLRELVRTLDASVPVFGVQTLQAIFEQRSVRMANLLRTIILSTALLGVLLAVVGVYAVVAYQAHRRTREIGLRMALGAQRHQMWALVIRQAGILGGTGVAIGLGISLAVSPALTVFAARTTLDVVHFLVASGTLVITGVVAAAIPARRASRVDPMVALRIE